MLPGSMLCDTEDSFTAPDGRVFTLVSHGEDLYIELDHQELMSTCSTGSEIALAEIGCRELAQIAQPRVLIGGLGFGFTLRAALECLPCDGSLVVAELFPEIVEWNRDYLEKLYGRALEDPRLQIVASDVWDEIDHGPWDAILLDTDNGPEAFSSSANNRLYGNVGLERMRSALTPKGRLAIWSADAEPAFVERMEIAGFDAGFETIRVQRPASDQDGLASHEITNYEVASHAVYHGQQRQP